MAGEPTDEVANVAAALGADAAGVNCSLGPQSVLEVVEQMAAHTSIRVSAMPNAGLPRFMDGRLIYPSTPDYFAEYTQKLVLAGRTSSATARRHEHTQPCARRCRRVAAGRAPACAGRGEGPEEEAGEKPRVARKLAAGEFVVSVSWTRRADSTRARRWKARRT
jgi:homocysteine S-methyltransferase